jgi:ubiquinone/menaquinone biosynthesis C-methylase UbiE
MYDTLASVAIAGVASELHGEAVLDVGAGTGALCRALRGAGAIPFAVDTSMDMLGQVGDSAILAIAGDMCALPFADSCFDAAVSGFAISHSDAPERALVEMRRVVRRRGRVMASVFGEAEGRVSKDVVDEVARQFGYQPPDWYVQLKTRTEPKSNTPALLRGCAEAAGLADIDIDDLTVDSGLTTPEAIVAPRSSIPSQLRAARRSSSSPWPQSANGVKPCGRGSSCSRVAFPRNEERPLAAARRAAPRVGLDGFANA